MNIKLETVDSVNAKLIVNIEEADYAPKVEKALKDIKKKAKMPGFRPGMAPIGLIKKMYGNEAKAEQVNRMLGEAVDNYIKENNINLLAAPLVSEGQENIDIVADANFEFSFDLGLAPEIDVTFTDKDELPYKNIVLGETEINAAVEQKQRQHGTFAEVDAWGEERDLLRGSLTELNADGDALEGGIDLSEVSIMPGYITNEEQKKILTVDAKKGANLTINPSEAYADKESELTSLLRIKKEEIENHKGNFQFHVNSVSRFVPAELNQELFDKVYMPEGTVTDAEAFRARVAAEAQADYKRDSDYKFQLDLREAALAKAGDVPLPTEFMRRHILENIPEEQKGDIDNILKREMDIIRWTLVRTQLAQNLGVKLDDSDLRGAARETIRIQFAQYGLNNIPDEQLDAYADNLLKDQKQQEMLVSRALDTKLVAAVKAVVKVKEEEISVADFNKLFEA